MAVREKFLEGKKIALKPYNRLTDLAPCYELMDDPEIRCWLENPNPVSLQQAEAELDRESSADNARLFIITLIESGIVIGIIKIEGINWINRTGSTEIVIKTNYCGYGYGTEAKLLLLDYAFNALNLRKMYTFVIEHNVRSRACNKKCGYKQEGRAKRQVFRDGKYYDTILLAIFKEDFLPVWKKYLSAED